MSEVIDMVGKRVGFLVVIERAPSRPGCGAAWHALCDCGNTCIALGASLRKRHKTSCGCRTRHRNTRRKHGGWGTIEYRIWMHMIERCYRVNDQRYVHYGGRGITVCDAWRADFAAFLRDVGARPSPELSIDRIDNDGNYEPGNVRWATRSQQNSNRRQKSLAPPGLEPVGRGIDNEGV